MRRSLHTATIFLSLLAASITSPQAAETGAKRAINVTGTGIVKARPDTASISIGVVTEAKTAREALDTNSAAMSRVIVELKGQGIAPNDIQTTGFSVSPRYENFKGGKPPIIAGYRVQNSATIIVRDLEKLGTTLDLTVSQGSNQINGIRFSVDDRAELENEARKRAMKDARQKAGLYAAASNAKLGHVLTISEDAISRPPRPVFRRAALEARGSAVPVEAGEQQITARVQVSWELKN